MDLNIFNKKIKTYMNSLSLRQKFSIPAGMVIFICFAVFTIYLLVDQNLQNKRALQENSERYARLIALSSVDHIWNFNTQGLNDTCMAFYTNPEIAKIRITDDKGDIILNLDSKPVKSEGITIKKDIMKNNQKFGELELVVTKDVYNRILLSIIFKLIGLFVVTFLIVLQSIWIITKRVIKPLDEMLAVVDKISCGDMSNSISVDSNDEIGKLAENFNNMMYKVKESISSIKSIIEFMPSIIIQFDHEWKIIECNRLAGQFMGITTEKAPGRFLKDIKPEIAVFLLNIKEFISFDKPYSLYRISLPGYDDMLFNIFIFMLRHEHSESLVLRIDDITELQKKDEQIRHIQKMESIGLLAGGVAHDFNNILGGILATASLLKFKIIQGKIKKPEDLSRDLDLVEKSCENGAAIASQLMNLSKKDSDFELKPHDINEVIDQIGEICIKSFDKSITISIKKHAKEAYAMMSNSQIHQVLLNLCINAAHSMTIMRKPEEHQGGHLDIEIIKTISDRFFIESHPEAIPGDYWRVSVKDTGTGMDKNTLLKIFDPFFTTKIQTTVKGTGLGLSIVYSIIKAHHGFIDVYSEIGIGTVFSIYLPACSENVSEAEKTAGKSIFTGEGTILVVDDEESMRNITCSILAECGYSFITGSNGEDAVKLYRENAGIIRAVILDMVMPVKSGYEALIDLMKQNPEIKILMTSGLYSNELIENVKKAGVKDFIVKPFSIFQLSKKLSSILNEEQS